MAKLEFDKEGERLYQTGVDHAVLYVKEEGKYKDGVAWNGITSINEKPSGAESTPFYADNIKYLTLISPEEFAFSIEAYMYPEEFKQCDGVLEAAKGLSFNQQTRTPFGISYRTKLGSDTKGQDYGYLLHLIYGAQASPTDKTYNTINESNDIATLSWDMTTTPIPTEIPGTKITRPTASIVIDSTKTTPAKLKKLEDKLYGTANTPATLPSPQEVIALLAAAPPTPPTPTP